MTAALSTRARAWVVVLGASLGSASGTAHTVKISDTAVWTVGVGVYYPEMSITEGEALKFVSTSHHDVVLLSAPSNGTHWDQCGGNGVAHGASITIFAQSSFSSGTSPLVEQHYTPPTCGDFYLACSVPPHCMYGQRVKVTVVPASGGTCVAPCVGAACVTVDSKRARAERDQLRDVKPAKNTEYWGQAPYDPLTVQVGDTVIFKTSGAYHDVAIVPNAAAFVGCDMTGMEVVAAWAPTMEVAPSKSCTGSSTCCAASSCGSIAAMGVATYTFTAKTPGDTYFVCSKGGGSHCKEGQKFMLTVLGDGNDALASQASPCSLYALLVALGLVAFP